MLSISCKCQNAFLHIDLSGGHGKHVKLTFTGPMDSMGPTPKAYDIHLTCPIGKGSSAIVSFHFSFFSWSIEMPNCTKKPLTALNRGIFVQNPSTTRSRKRFAPLGDQEGCTCVWSNNQCSIWAAHNATARFKDIVIWPMRWDHLSMPSQPGGSWREIDSRSVFTHLDNPVPSS